MAFTVNSAFQQFLADSVRLDPDETTLARRSRDWLKGQIAAIGGRTDDFPRLVPDYNVDFGSFARRTKILRVDDIDMMIGMHAEQATYWPMTAEANCYWISTVPGSRLHPFADNGVLNSRRVINIFVKELGSVPQYRQAAIKRDHQAATLQLQSYPWNFDIVPCFQTVVEAATGRRYYLIPDGDGNWMKTDACIDQQQVTRLNQLHGGKVLDVIRLVKFWNRRSTMPSTASYLLECMVLDYARGILASGQSLQSLVAGAIRHVAGAILGYVGDPKAIGGDINRTPWDDRQKIHVRANQDVHDMIRAEVFEAFGNHREAIACWQTVFGPDFPSYG